MGSCHSCDSTHVATAKLILQDGGLQEFSYPVKVSYVLSKINNPTYFICNADEMEFDDIVSAVNDDDLLQPGQLYFALPLNRLKRRLQPEEMAALAVKASSALMRSNHNTNSVDKCGFCRKSVSSIVFSGDEKSSSGVPSSAASGNRSRGGAGGRRKFTAMLNAIPE